MGFCLRLGMGVGVGEGRMGVCVEFDVSIVMRVGVRVGLWEGGVLDGTNQDQRAKKG